MHGMKEQTKGIWIVPQSLNSMWLILFLVSSFWHQISWWPLNLARTRLHSLKNGGRRQAATEYRSSPCVRLTKSRRLGIDRKERPGSTGSPGMRLLPASPGNHEWMIHAEQCPNSLSKWLTGNGCFSGARDLGDSAFLYAAVAEVFLRPWFARKTGFHDDSSDLIQSGSRWTIQGFGSKLFSVSIVSSIWRIDPSNKKSFELIHHFGKSENYASQVTRPQWSTIEVPCWNSKRLLT
jgi:hypothetical protein